MNYILDADFFIRTNTKQF